MYSSWGAPVALLPWALRFSSPDSLLSFLCSPSLAHLTPDFFSLGTSMVLCSQIGSSNLAPIHFSDGLSLPLLTLDQSSIVRVSVQHGVLVISRS